jgi:hypothetical protein
VTEANWAPRPEAGQTGDSHVAPVTVAHGSVMGAHMDDQEIVERINTLAAEEQRLEEAHVGEGLDDDELARKRELEITLDQLWDVLRQRRAKRSAGQDPDSAAARPPGTVEGYLQ